MALPPGYSYAAPPVGFPHPGYAPPGYPSAGYAPAGYPPAGYAPAGYPPAGYPQTAYPPGFYPPGPYPWVPPPLKPPHRTLPLVAGVGIYVILVVGLVVAGNIANVIDPWLTSVAVALAVLICLLIIAEGPALGFASYVRRRWGDGTWASIGWKWRWSDLGWGALTWLAGFIAATAMSLLIVLLNIPSEGNLQVDPTREPSLLGKIVLITSAVVIAPLTEELICRGVMLRSFLSRMPVALAILVQGVLFGCAHIAPERGLGNIGLVMVTATLGCVFGASAYLRRGIGTTIIAHAIFNAVAVTLFLATQ